MAENKTRPTDAGVEAYLAAIDEDGKREDCRAIARMMQRVTGEPPVLWGDSIVGFGQYHYRYASGREGDAALTGFSARRKDISIYLTCVDDGPARERLAKLGRHKMGKACLSIRRLSEVDVTVLEDLVRDAVAGIRRLYG